MGKDLAPHSANLFWHSPDCLFHNSSQGLFKNQTKFSTHYANAANVPLSKNEMAAYSLKVAGLTAGLL